MCAMIKKSQQFLILVVSWLCFVTNSFEQQSGIFMYSSNCKPNYVQWCYNTVFLSYNNGESIVNTNNTEILIGDIGESNREGLFCHTDLLTCCRIADNVNGSGNGQGEWFYPNGSVINRELIALTNGEGFYSQRREQSVRLDRFQATNVLSPTGSFCCTVPTTVGDTIFCANLGMRLLWEAHLHALMCMQLCVCPFLLLPMEPSCTVIHSQG